MGGIDVGGALYEQVKRGIDYAGLKSYAKLDADKGAAAMKNYVYGDWTMENTSARLVSGKDELRFEEEIKNAEGEMATALTTAQGNGRLIQMVNSGNVDVNAVRLGHESYRNGVIDSGQTKETVRAVMAHTKMAARMALNGADFSGDADIMQDLYEFYKASAGGNMSAFTKYAMDSYDSSADFWRLTANGGLKYDGSGWLKREDGTYILDANGNRIGAESIEAGLIKILGVDKNDKAAVALVQKLMIGANIQHTSGEDPDNWYWDRLDTRDGETVNLKALNMGKTITFGSLLAGGYGNSVSTPVFMNGFDVSTDHYLYGSLTTKFKAMDAVPGYVYDRYVDFAAAKSQFYEGISALVVGDSYLVKNGGYKDKSEDPERYKNYNNLHYGIDIGTHQKNLDILSGISGVVVASGYDTEMGYGNFAQIEYGYQFEGFTYRTGIIGEYAHMKDLPLVNNGDFVTGGTQLGFVGNTGASTGEHLHYSVYTKPGKTYATNIALRIFGADYMNTAMTNKPPNDAPSTKTVYDPLGFYNKYKG
jgi:murein DD-endopeptidase MepM/ murein hydrolase activator NlpD